MWVTGVQTCALPILRGKYLVDVVGFNQVNGMPIKAADLADAIGTLVAEAEDISPDDFDLTPTAPVSAEETL